VSGSLDVEVRFGECPVVRVAGRVDSETIGRFEQALDYAVSVTAPEVVVDLSGVRGFDRSGVEALERLRQRVSTVHLRRPPPAVLQVLPEALLADGFVVDDVW
jgi:anti-anti-sigma regulatory factor